MFVLYSVANLARYKHKKKNILRGALVYTIVTKTGGSC